MEELQLKPDPIEAYNLPGEPSCEASGIFAGELPDEDEVYSKACAISQKHKLLTRRRKNQFLRFSHGPIGLCFFGDLHFGGNGVDYEKAFRDAQIIRSTPGLYAVLAGADLDNFVVSKLLHYNMDNALTIDDQWTLFRRWLRIIGPKLRIVVSGNHDVWTWLLTRVDYMEETVASFSKNCIYDQNDCLITLQVGDRQWPGRIRHRWRGTSIYNPTHGMERAMKWEAANYVWCAGAHDHDGGCVRESNLGGIPRLCVKTWTYKFDDFYTRAQGYPTAGPHESPSIIFEEKTGEMFGISSLDLASLFLTQWYKEAKP